MSEGSKGADAQPLKVTPWNSAAAATDGVRGRSVAFMLARVADVDALTSALGRLSVFVATAIVVTVAVVSASFVSYAVWWLATDVMPTNVIPISATVALIVATPIATYLIWIIQSFARSRGELAELSAQLIVARDHAREANEAKSRFLASTSHELRTPLNAILGFSEILKDELFGPCGEERYVDYARDIHTSGKHLLSLINDVLDLSKIESGQEHAATFSECDLVEILADASKMVRIVAEKSAVRLCVLDALKPIYFQANYRMMRQIILNLLSNAVKFTPEGGCVTVSVGSDLSGAVIFEVADTGIGMTADELKVAMQPFGQIDSHLSRRHDGTGLGLPLSKAMVELHGGALTIHSIPGEGTTVRFSIPSERQIADDPMQRVAAFRTATT